MIQIIDNNFGRKFYGLLDITEERLFIMSPFISLETANRLALWLEDLDVQCTLITRFNREEFIKGANSIQGLIRLHEVGAKIFALQHLHTKLYIFDTHSVLLGSSNFTISGFFKNHELGIFVQDEPDFTKSCSDYYENMFNKIQENGKWEVTHEILLKEAKAVEIALENRKKDENVYNLIRWGAILDTNENDALIQQIKNQTNDPADDFLEELLRSIELEEKSSMAATGYRIKFEGTSKERIPSDLVYLDRKRSLHEHLNRTYYPRPPRSVKPGETIFMAVVSEKDGRGTPIIIGYATVPDGFREENIINNLDYNYKRWNMRYPYFIEYTDAKFIKQPIREGISLMELCEALRHEVYPSTSHSPETPITKIRTRHHQKAHIEITKKAAEYLKQKLDKQFLNNNYDEVK